MVEAIELPLRMEDVLDESIRQEGYGGSKSFHRNLDIQIDRYIIYSLGRAKRKFWGH